MSKNGFELDYKGVGTGILRADFMKNYIQSQINSKADRGSTVKVTTGTQRIWGTAYKR